MLRLSKDHNPNYVCKIVELSNERNHLNAKRLKIVNIDGNSVIVGLDDSIGDVGIFFPLECAINQGFLKANNLFRDKALNADPEARAGFFEHHGRVRAVKLRGERSEGFWCPVTYLENFLVKHIMSATLQDMIGKEFDTVTGDLSSEILLCKKYISGRNPAGKEREKRSKKPKVSRIIDGQFNFHDDTAQLGKNIHRVQSDDYISITYKVHGTSSVNANVICTRRLNVVERILRFFGVNINDIEYSNIYSSRKVVKNDDANKVQNHYYSYDLWEEINAKLKSSLLDGITIYSEAVGYLKTGGYIQKGYDYGCAEGQFAVYPYRITYTSMSGRRMEFTWKQIEWFCNSQGLTHVPILYYGKAKDLFPINTEYHWHETFLQKLKDAYLEKDCYMCKNKVPAEGIVLRVEKPDFEAYKLKSFAFLSRESEMLDRGESDLEEEQNLE